VNGRIYSRYVSAVKKNSCFLEQQFLQSKRQRKRSRQTIVTLSSHQGDKYATPDSTRGRVDDGLLPADHRRLFMLCWAARTPDVLINPAARAADTVAPTEIP
jgi:hypothetical protein